MKIEDNVEVTSAILGTYEGECADANITNLNGLDITREVWENVFNSEEYKKAIKLKQYIGFLGHPEGEADCQDFRKACIIMTEGHIADDGKVYGKFDLVDTPVGRIVKAFQDAGVIFGISVRGAGDIIQNSVDPDTFIFRGFDLVTFPAYPNAIPTFTAIAASTDTEQRRKYQAVCASVKANMNSLDSVQSIDMIQSCFAKQSEEYQELEARKAEILGDGLVNAEPLPEPGSESLVCEDEACTEIDPRVDAMTKLYLETKEQFESLKNEHIQLKNMYEELIRDNSRRIDSIERICSSQMHKLSNQIDANQASYTYTLNKVNNHLRVKKNQLVQATTSLVSTNKKFSDLVTSSEAIKSELESVKASVADLTEENENLKKALISATDTISELKSENLEYNTKIEAFETSQKEKDSIIASLKSKLDETVNQNAQEKKNASNLDEQIESLKSEIQASEALIKEYQDAYSGLYAHALGVRLPHFRVTASTDVSSLQKMIRSSTSITVKPSIMEPTLDEESYIDVDEYDEDELITL